MKKITLLTFLLAVMMPTILQAQQNNPEFLRAKIEKFSQMKRTGTVMLIAGAASTAGGIVLLANSDWDQTSSGSGSTSYHSNDNNAILGVLLTGIGLGLAGGGLAMTLVGKKKIEFYKNQLPELTLAPIINSNCTGLHLSLRF